MDSLRGGFSDENEPEMLSTDDDAADDAGIYSARSLAGGDERRMQVRAYNFWASLLDNRTFPDVADLHPENLTDFGPNSVLLDFTKGLENPAIAYLGTQLAAECGAEGEIRTLGDVPPRSLLTRITDHYLQIIANQAPIGFEAEFVNQRGSTILYRGILLPFSHDDRSIDFIYGVINWKELADQDATDALMQRVDESVEPRPAMLRERLDAPLTEWADGPVDFAIDRKSIQEPSGFELPEPGFLLSDEYLLDQPLEEVPDLQDAGLADWLASARELALAAQGSEERSHHALYAAIGRAYDFALAAADAPEDFAELVQDAGIKMRERAPLVPLVKLVFGADYDKTRLAEFAAAIAHGRRLGLVHGELACHLSETPGGLKAVVREERRLRREESGGPDHAAAQRARLANDLRALETRPFAAVAGEGQEFTVLVARRLAGGEVVLLGEVADDEALLERAAKRLLR